MEHPWLVDDDDEKHDPVPEDTDKSVDLVELGLLRGYGVKQCGD